VLIGCNYSFVLNGLLGTRRNEGRCRGKQPVVDAVLRRSSLYS